jgi:hypothetical protein
MNISLMKKRRMKMSSEENSHKQKKLEIMYRYSMPLQWVLDKVEDGKYDEISKFDILNAQHELDILMDGWHRIKESDN